MRFSGANRLRSIADSASSMVLSSNVQFQGRWDLDSDDRYVTHWCGSSLYFQTTSRSVTLQLGSLTVSRKNYHNVLWRFGSQSVTRTSLVKGQRAMILTPSGAGAGSTHGGEVLLDVTVMLCDWGATLQILDITAVCIKDMYQGITYCFV